MSLRSEASALRACELQSGLLRLGTGHGSVARLRRETNMSIADRNDRRGLVKRRSTRRALGLLGLLLLSSACETEELQSGAGTLRADAGSGAAGRGGSGAASPVSAGSADAGADAASGSVARDAFRPLERAATPELVASLRLPAGFRIDTFADDLGHARMLAVRGADVYLTRPMQADVLRLRDVDGDGRADERDVVASGLTGVHGIVFRGADLYLATPTAVYRASIAGDGQLSTPMPIVMDLPDGGQHPNRTLGIGPDDRLYISVGSSCDACDETNPEHATMLRALPDGSSREVFARGLRNTIGFAWHPTTEVLWGMDHGSDWRGADLPPEELNRIESGSDYGWPYCFGQRQLDPIIQDPPDTTKAAYCAETAPATLETQAHHAPIGLVFYTAAAFPADYRNDAFVAMRGSWNRIPATGYQIARIDFDASGQPRRFEPFVDGFLSADGQSTFARPAGISVDAAGALLFTDDSNGVIYRVSYVGAGAADAGALPADAGAAELADAGAPDAG